MCCQSRLVLLKCQIPPVHIVIDRTSDRVAGSSFPRQFRQRHEQLERSIQIVECILMTSELRNSTSEKNQAARQLPFGPGQLWEAS